jgi:DNA repair ATPase RecN
LIYDYQSPYAKALSGGKFQSATIGLDRFLIFVSKKFYDKTQCRPCRTLEISRMNSKEFQKIIDSVMDKVQAGRTKLEKNVPALEKNMKYYARKFGIKPEDIDAAKEKVRKKLDQIQKNK